MSPRSQDLFETARRRVRDAHAALEIGTYDLAVTASYYAMLYAARAALSEADLNARTHRGIWGLFRERWVLTGAFDAELAAAATRQQQAREQVDYQAREATREEATEAVAVAERFVGAVERLLG